MNQNVALALSDAHSMTSSAQQSKSSLEPFKLPGDWIDHRGRAVADDFFRNRTSLIVLAYSQCPTLCPMTAERVRKVELLLQEKKILVDVILVSIDPQRETPSTLRRWLNARNLNGKNWHFIKSDIASTHALAAKLSMGFSDEKSPSHISHTSRIAIVNSRGGPVVSFDLLSGSVADLVQKIEVTLGKSG